MLKSSIMLSPCVILPRYEEYRIELGHNCDFNKFFNSRRFVFQQKYSCKELIWSHINYTLIKYKLGIN